jgi:hypothetical protein
LYCLKIEVHNELVQLYTDKRWNVFSFSSVAKKVYPFPSARFSMGIYLFPDTHKESAKRLTVGLFMQNGPRTLQKSKMSRKSKKSLTSCCEGISKVL